MDLEICLHKKWEKYIPDVPVEIVKKATEMRENDLFGD